MPRDPSKECVVIIRVRWKGNHGCYIENSPENAQTICYIGIWITIQVAVYIYIVIVTNELTDTAGVEVL